MRDLNLLSLDGIIDSLGLPYRMWVKDQGNKRLALILDGAHVDNMTMARQHGSLLLHYSKSESAVEVPLSSLSTPELSEMIEGMRQKGLVMGLGRNLYHLVSLKAGMKSLNLFHPRLELADGCVHVSQHVMSPPLSASEESPRAKHGIL